MQSQKIKRHTRLAVKQTFGSNFILKSNFLVKFKKKFGVLKIIFLLKQIEFK